MRLRFLLLFLIIIALVCDVTLAGKDRKKSRKKDRNEEGNEEEEEDRRGGGGGGFAMSEDKRKETKDRVMDLAEKREEQKERHEKKEESSEEKDKDEKESNATEIVIPVRFRRHEKMRHRRHEHSLKRTSEINNGVQTALDKKPAQDHQCGPNCKHQMRHRRHEQTLTRTAEVNDGVQTSLDTKPKQDHQCGDNCKHTKREADDDLDIANGVMLTEDDGITLIRHRRAKSSKGKELGHRVATHPHTGKRTGIKAGRRRGQNSLNTKAKKDKQKRDLDRVYYRSYYPQSEEFEKKYKPPRPVNDDLVVSADAATITDI